MSRKLADKLGEEIKQEVRQAVVETRRPLADPMQNVRLAYQVGYTAAVRDCGRIMADQERLRLRVGALARALIEQPEMSIENAILARGDDTLLEQCVYGQTPEQRDQAYEVLEKRYGTEKVVGLLRDYKPIWRRGEQ